jgi:DNA-binding transcriptional LysR family regulator
MAEIKSDPSEAYLQDRVDAVLANVLAEARKEGLDPDLVAWPCFDIHRVIIAPVGHPLLGMRRPTLEDIARYPLITYDQGVSAGWRIMETFTRHDLAPEIVLSAAGAGVIKAYVAACVGIAIIQKLAFDRRRDAGIRAMPADHLFAPVTASLMIRRGARLPDAAHDLVLGLVPAQRHAAVHTHLL